MASAPPRPAPFTDEELKHVLELAKSSDSVELKLTVPEEDQRSTAVALGLDPLQAQIRAVYFFDTPELELDRHGLVVRARRVQGRGDDSVVKLRPVVPETLPDELRASPSMIVEVDAMPGGYVCSASLKRRLDTTPVRDAAAGRVPIRKAFSKEQRAFFTAHAPEGVELDALTPLGPLYVLKLSFVPEGFDRKLVAELWFYPEGSRILELSTKCEPAMMFQVAAEARSFLAGHGVSFVGAQQTKTRAALEYYAEQMKSGKAG